LEAENMTQPEPGKCPLCHEEIEVDTRLPSGSWDGVAPQGHKTYGLIFSTQCTKCRTDLIAFAEQSSSIPSGELVWSEKSKDDSNAVKVDDVVQLLLDREATPETE
jgi:hypothetical protein